MNLGSARQVSTRSCRPVGYPLTGYPAWSHPPFSVPTYRLRSALGRILISLGIEPYTSSAFLRNRTAIFSQKLMGNRTPMLPASSNQEFRPFTEFEHLLLQPFACSDPLRVPCVYHSAIPANFQTALFTLITITSLASDVKATEE